MRPLIRLIQKTYRMVDPLEGAKVLHNVTSLSGLQLVTYFFPLIILPYLFRVVGPDKFGLIAFAQAFVQYFMILTDYGFSITATKEISLCHNDKTRLSQVFSVVMTVKIILVLFSGLILYGLLYAVPKFRADSM